MSSCGFEILLQYFSHDRGNEDALDCFSTIMITMRVVVATCVQNGEIRDWEYKLDRRADLLSWHTRPHSSFIAV